MSVLFKFLFFPRPLLHTAPLEFVPGMQCEGGGAWSARTRHETLRRCRRVWEAVRLVAVVPRRVGAVPVLLFLSIPFSIFFFPSGL